MATGASETPPQTREQFAETGCTFSDEAWVRFNAQRQSIASLLQWQEAAYIRELRFQTRIDALTAENPTCLGHVPSNPAAPCSEQRCGRCGQSAPCEVRRMWILWGQMKRAAATFRAALDAYRLAYGDPASEPIQRDLTWAAAELDQADAK